MWSRGTRSVALERAQALLSAQSSPGGRSGPGQPAGPSYGQHGGPGPGHTGTVGDSALSDLSDVSWLSSDAGHGADSRDSAAARAASGRTRAEEEDHDLRPQSALGGGGSRFLKKARPPAAISSQSPVSKSQTQMPSETRSSLRGSQAAALRRLAEMESLARSHKQARQGPKPATENLTSDTGISATPPVTPAVVTSEHLSAQPSSEQSLRGKRFLKNRAAVVGTSNDHADAAAAAAAAPAPSGTPPVLEEEVRSKARAADVVRAVSGVSLESDEEDMRELLGDSLDSTDGLISWRRSSVQKADKMLSKSSERIHHTPPPPSLAKQALPTLPSHRSSPFRFTGQAQAQFSPPVFSPISSSSPGVQEEQPPRTASPQDSSISCHSEVLSLDELFPVRPGSKEPHSDISTVPSYDFQMNVLSLDDLGYAEERPTQQRETKEEGGKQQELEAEPDYQSDFESESQTQLGDSDSQVSEVREEATDSRLSHSRTEDNYSSTFSDTSRTYTSQKSEHRKKGRRRRSRSSTSSQPCVSDGTGAFSQQSERCSSSPQAFKEAATQTHPELGHYTPPAGLAVSYMAPSLLVTDSLSADAVEALSTFNPALFAFNELLKQQLATIQRFFERNRDAHSRLLQSLDPPSYRYTTLADTMERILQKRQRRKPCPSVRETH